MGSQKPETLNSSNSTRILPKPYGNVVLSLNNVLLPEEKLNQTPSKEDGMDLETETSLRILGCELIQTAGILLKLPQVAMATGQVLFQRFYYSKSFVRHSMETTAMACVCLASKIEEAPRKVRDIINVFTHIRQVNAQKPIKAVIPDANYIALKTQVIKAERRVLKELGFCVHVKHPHKIIVMYLKVLGFQNHNNLIQLSWNYMNDSLRSDVFMRYDPEAIACACIFLSARKMGICLPKQPAWYLLFSVTLESIHDICRKILKLYKRPKENVDELEKKVELLKRIYMETRQKKDKTNTGNNTPNNVSPLRHHQSQKSEKSRSRSRSRSSSPHVKHKRSKKHKSRSRSRSRSNDRRKKHKRRSYTPSPSPQSRSRSNHKHSRSRSRSRSVEKKSKKHRRKSYSASPSPTHRSSSNHRHSRYIHHYTTSSSYV